MRWRKRREEHLLLTSAAAVIALLTLPRAASGNRSTYHESEFFKLDSLFKGKPYDRRATPTQDSEQPTMVSVEMYLRSLGSINPVEMDYTADLYLRQRWIESRFVNNSLTRPLDVSDPLLVKKIWKPEVYFPNAKSGDFQYVSVPNVLIRVHPSGEVLYILRLLLRFSCMMDLSNYPLDTQVCSIETAVFSKTTRELQLTWFYSDPIKLYANLRLPQFQVKKVQAEQCRYENKLGNYSCLEAKFLLDRNFGYHLVQSYIPSSLIVVISWVSFWLDVDAIPSRVTLGVTTLLTICSESSGNTDKMPPVSYMKALDIWMSVCTAFIFTALLEFTLVNQLSRPRRQMVCWVMHVTKGVPERSLYMPDLCEEWCVIRQQLKKKRDDMPSLTLQLVDGVSGGGGGAVGAAIGGEGPAGRRCFCQRRMSAADWIDRVSRLGFPLAFCAFGAFYWTHYQK